MSNQISTRLTRLLGIRTPVVGAAMTGPSGGKLAAAITNGGGFGFMSAGRAPSFEHTKKEIDIARSLLPKPSSPLPIGVGFFGFELDSSPQAVSILDAVLAENVGAIWLSFSVNLSKWCRYVRERAPGIIIVVQLPMTKDAVEAHDSWDVDVIVLQGGEAGGHSFDTAPPISSLLATTLHAIPNRKIPILAAGGIATGSQLASLLVLGADGVVIGTRFSTATESLLSQSKKDHLVSVHKTNISSPTIRSYIFDELKGIRQMWPPGTTARGLKMPLMLQDEAEGKSLEERQAIHQANAQEGGTHEIIWAGTGVGLIEKVQPASDIVRELHEEAVASITAASQLLAPKAS